MEPYEAMLFNTLVESGNDELCRSLFAIQQEQSIRNLSIGQTKRLHIRPIALQENSEAVVDAILSDAEGLINKGEIKEALSKLINGLNALISSVYDKAINLEVITNRIENIKDIAFKAAEHFGAKDFTIGLSMSVPPSISIEFHFEAVVKK